MASERRAPLTLTLHLCPSSLFSTSPAQGTRGRSRGWRTRNAYSRGSDGRRSGISQARRGFDATHGRPPCVDDLTPCPGPPARGGTWPLSSCLTSHFEYQTFAAALPATPKRRRSTVGWTRGRPVDRCIERKRNHGMRRARCGVAATTPQRPSPRCVVREPAEKRPRGGGL